MKFGLIKKMNKKLPNVTQIVVFPLIQWKIDDAQCKLDRNH